MAELVDALDSKSSGSNTMRVQVPPRPPKQKSFLQRRLFCFGQLKEYFNPLGVAEESSARLSAAVYCVHSHNRAPSLPHGFTCASNYKRVDCELEDSRYCRSYEALYMLKSVSR